LVDARSGAKLLVTGKIAEVDAENKIVRIDLDAKSNDLTVLGKAQVKVQL
jgi:hypothetical protein